MVELASPGDEGPHGLTALRAVEIWEPLAEPPTPPRRLEEASCLDGDPHFPGLAVDLEEIWAG